MSVRLTPADGRSPITGIRRHVRKAAAAVFAGALLAGGTVAAAPAAAQADNSAMCTDGYTLAAAYNAMGAYATELAILWNMLEAGCA
jgi:hypothetical protein